MNIQQFLYLWCLDWLCIERFSRCVPPITLHKITQGFWVLFGNHVGARVVLWALQLAVVVMCWVPSCELLTVLHFFRKMAPSGCKFFASGFCWHRSQHGDTNQFPRCYIISFIKTIHSCFHAHSPTDDVSILTPAVQDFGVHAVLMDATLQEDETRCLASAFSGHKWNKLGIGD